MEDHKTNQAPEGQAPGQATASAAADAAPPPSLEEQLTKAEADNVRKRAQADVQNAHKFGIESFAESLLPVKDSLDAALAAQNNTVETLRSGVELTRKQLVAAFEKFKLNEIDPVGQKFDPHRHQAMSMVEAGAEPNTVVQVFQKGYALHERVLRPALVSVAKPKGA